MSASHLTPISIELSQRRILHGSVCSNPRGLTVGRQFSLSCIVFRVWRIINCLLGRCRQGGKVSLSMPQWPTIMRPVPELGYECRTAQTYSRSTLVVSMTFTNRIDEQWCHVRMVAYDCHLIHGVPIKNISHTLIHLLLLCFSKLLSFITSKHHIKDTRKNTPYKRQ